VLKYEIDTGQGLVESDLLLHHQVGTLALEGLVWLLLNDDDHVTWLCTWVLISFTVEGVGLTIWCTFVNLNVNDLLLFVDLLTIALLASVLLIDDFTLAAAFVAWALRLRVHARSKLLHFRDHATSLALWALLDSTVLATFASAICADALTIDGNFGFLTIVHVFKSNLQGVLEWLHLLWASLLLASATATEHLTQDIVHAARAAAASLLESLLTILVVCCTFLFVTQNFSCLLNLLELLLVTTAIWVILKCCLSVGLLDIVAGSIFAHSKQLVEALIVDWALRLRLTEAPAHSTEWESTASAAATEKHVITLLKLKLVI